MNKFFNPKIYLEGIKKIKVTGIACSIIIIVLNAIVPIIYGIANFRNTISIISADKFAYPMALNMFSFLNKRNESDFYHAIPYTRICVYVSFMAAILTWIWGIILVSCAVTTLLWQVFPNVQLGFSALWIIPVSYILVTTFIVSIMTFSMMLTGTTFTNLCTAALSMFLTRAVGMMVTSCMSTAVWAFDINYSTGAFFSIDFFLPYAILKMLFMGDVSNLLSQQALYIWTACITVVMLGISGFLYWRRRSEIAGMTATSPVMHHVIRCLITLPFALILTSYLISSAYSRSNIDSTVFILLTVLTLLVYFIYELVSTKSWRKMLRSTPLLLTVVAGCLIFTAGINISYQMIVNDTPDPEDIKSIRIYNDASDNTYEDLTTRYSWISNDEAITIAANGLKKAMESVKDGKRYWNIYDDYQTIDVAFKTAGGRVLGRKVLLKREDAGRLYQLCEAAVTDSSYYSVLPDMSEINDIIVNVQSFENSFPDDKRTVWLVFTEEYKTLTLEQKMLVKTTPMKVPRAYAGSGSEAYIYLSVSGVYNGDYFSSLYTVPDCMPKTQKAIRDLYFNYSNEKEIAEILAIEDSEQVTSIRFTCISSEFGTVWESLDLSVLPQSTQDRLIGEIKAEKPTDGTAENLTEMVFIYMDGDYYESVTVYFTMSRDLLTELMPYGGY